MIRHRKILGAKATSYTYCLTEKPRGFEVFFSYQYMTYTHKRAHKRATQAGRKPNHVCNLVNFNTAMELRQLQYRPGRRAKIIKTPHDNVLDGLTQILLVRQYRMPISFYFTVNDRVSVQGESYLNAPRPRSTFAGPKLEFSSSRNEVEL